MKIYSHQACIEHEVSPGHPERPERLSNLLAHLSNIGLTHDYPLHDAPRATNDAILRAHPTSHLDHLEQSVPLDGVIPIDPDTWMGRQSLAAALVAAGAVCAGIDDVVKGSDSRVFCAVRPPGHHAESDAAMGFCLLNSVAIGALHALQKAEIGRVAILDFDVHHGNGTVEICKDHPDVLVCSSFQHPFYPHRFYDSDWPNIINTPLPAGSGSYEFRAAIERDWLPAVAAHQPDLILISAGFDAHALDPLAALNLEDDDFRWVTELIVSLASEHANGRIVSALEGGYDLDALNSSVTAHLGALA
ncbi:MAG: histone deacetylase family protein [Pseudomonadales bacterium]|nr:histone deacetylase family protein [Pseudomonadales bacterium]